MTRSYGTFYSSTLQIRSTEIFMLIWLVIFLISWFSYTVSQKVLHQTHGDNFVSS